MSSEFKSRFKCWFLKSKGKVSRNPHITSLNFHFSYVFVYCEHLECINTYRQNTLGNSILYKSLGTLPSPYGYNMATFQWNTGLFSFCFPFGSFACNPRCWTEKNRLIVVLFRLVSNFWAIGWIIYILQHFFLARLL